MITIMISTIGEEVSASTPNDSHDPSPNFNPIASTKSVPQTRNGIILFCQLVFVVD